MAIIIENDKLTTFKKNLSKCVNVERKTFNNKETILSSNLHKKQLGFILYGKASIIKTDINGNSTIMRELKDNDIFTNLSFKNTEDEIYIESNKTTEVLFIDYKQILKNCNKNCPFHNSLILSLYELLIDDNKKHYEKIELLSKRTVREKLIFFLKTRTNKDGVFKVTTSFKAIAEYISVDRSNLMRELKKMEQEKIIKKEGKYITFIN